MTAWKVVLGARDEETKERCMKTCREEKRKVRRCIYQSKKELNEQFGMKMNQYVNGNKKLFWKEVGKENGGKVEICIIVKDGNGRLALGELEGQKIWNDYFDDLYNIET